MARRAARSELDTLVPATASGEDQSAYRRRSQQARYLETVRRRARRRRILTFLAAALVVVGIAAAAGFLAFRGTVGSSLALRDSDVRDALAAADDGEASYTLVAAELGAAAEPLDQAGPDLIVLVRADEPAGKLAFVGVPSSLRVAVDNDTHRLADLAQQGDAALVSAVESYAKIDVSHFVKLDRGDVEGLVDAIGGIEVTFDQVIDDPQAGDVYYPAGTYTVNGPGALTYLRATNLRMGRTDQVENQAAFVELAIRALMGADRGFTGALEAVGSYIQTDLSLSQLESFASWMGGLPEESVVSTMLPGYFTSSSDVVEGDDVLFVSKAADFASLLEQLGVAGEDDVTSSSASEPIQVNPGSFTVEVLNGTDIAGAASATADALAASGFTIADVGNAQQQVYDETLVIYRTQNTPSAAEAHQDGESDDEGEYDGDFGDSYDDGQFDDGGQADAAASAPSALPNSPEETRALGEARAKQVISALGIGRVVEGDMYYTFDADVLLVIGYDYKPIA